MDEDSLRELQESVAREGILQPLLVREDGVTPDGRVRYVVIAGARRLRAAKAAGLIRLPVVVRSVEDARELRVLQLVENLQREDLDPIEEAVALRELMELRDLSTREAGELIHRSHMHVQRRLDLLFDDRIVSAVLAGRVNASVAAEIKSMPDAIRETYVARAAAGEPFDVAALREAKRQARAVIWGDRQGHREGPSVTNRYTAGAQVPTEIRASETEPPDQGAFGHSGERPAHGKSASGTDTQDGQAAGDAVTPAHQSDLPHEPARDALTGRVMETQEGSDTSVANDWALALVTALLKPTSSRANRAAIEVAVRTWQEAGRPNWWGVALLHTLAQHLDLT